MLYLYKICQRYNRCFFNLAVNCPHILTQIFSGANWRTPMCTESNLSQKSRRCLLRSLLTFLSWPHAKWGRASALISVCPRPTYFRVISRQPIRPSGSLYRSTLRKGASLVWGGGGGEGAGTTVQPECHICLPSRSYCRIVTNCVVISPYFLPELHANWDSVFLVFPRRPATCSCKGLMKCD